MGNAITTRGEKEHLIFERVCGKRPAMAENDRLTLAPVFVLDLCAIFGGESAHGRSFLVGDL